MSVILLDGPVGTELIARGFKSDESSWTAHANDSASDLLSQVHREYADAGASVHTANTFRTKRRNVGDDWRRLTQLAVQIARQAIPSEHRLAGSIAPLEDCYRPDLSPELQHRGASQREHVEMAETLAESGCDLILCETFACVEEAVVATVSAVSTGLPVWTALTAGPDANLMTAGQMGEAATQVADAGAALVLVNCTPAIESIGFVEAIADVGLSVPLGVYANAGKATDGVGWSSECNENGIERYVCCARQWVRAGASVLGGCCGTSPAHIAKLREFQSQ